MVESDQQTLRPGMVIVLGGKRYRVDMVNESRARCQPIEQRYREYVPQTGRNAGKAVRYFEALDPISISPHSAVEIVG